MSKRRRAFYHVAREDARKEDRAFKRLLRDPKAPVRLAAALGKKAVRLREITFRDLERLAEMRERRERGQCYRLLSKIYAILGDPDWRVRLVRLYDDAALGHRLGVGTNKVGTVDVEERIIYVDFRDELLATVVHECLHVILDGRFEGRRAHEREEEEVQRLEKLIMRRMSRCQARRLLRLIVERVEK
jgi:hypothetical protein